MPTIYGLAQDPAAAPAPATSPSVQEIPFDYVAKFDLTGTSGNRIQQTINISTEGAFIAGEIGYSFLPSLTALGSIPAPADTEGNEITSSTDVTSAARSGGVQGYLHEALTTLIVADLGDSDAAVSHRPVLRWLATRLIGVDFLYSIVDTATGRELQNRSVHNLAGLGEPTGKRPFRPFPKPMLFTPGTTIRIEIEEVSEGSLFSGAQLFLVLHGYKDLAYSGRR